MRRPRLALMLALSLALLPALGAEVAKSAVPPGLYRGSMDMGGVPTSFVLKILPEGGGLIDIPGEQLYGYPLSALTVSGKRLIFTIGADPLSSLRFDATVVAPASANRGMPKLEGRYSRSGTRGKFTLEAVPEPASEDIPYAVDVSGGSIRGSLLLPDPAAFGKGPFPLAVLVAGAGTTDRNGNNYNVPGRNNALAMLAAELKARGVASYRYDKRGSGESYLLAGKEEDSRFSDYIDDAAFVLNSFERDARFSRVVLVGHTEGALVAAAVAAEAFLASDASDEGLSSTKLSSLVLLCASGLTAAESFGAAMADTPPGLKPEVAAIISALQAGKPYPKPSPYFSSFFRPSIQPYLISWFSYDIRAELAAFTGQVVCIHGNRDLQVSLDELDLLARARPDAPVFVLPTMNHALKSVSGSLEENYRTFSDPSFPLAPGLGDIIAALAKGEALPSDYPRYDGESRLPSGLR